MEKIAEEYYPRTLIVAGGVASPMGSLREACRAAAERLEVPFTFPLLIFPRQRGDDCRSRDCKTASRRTCGAGPQRGCNPAIGKYRREEGCSEAGRRAVIGCRVSDTIHAPSHEECFCISLYYAPFHSSQPDCPTPSSTRQKPGRSRLGAVRKSTFRTGVHFDNQPSAPAGYTALDIGAIKLRNSRTMRRDLPRLADATILWPVLLPPDPECCASRLSMFLMPRSHQHHFGDYHRPARYSAANNHSLMWREDALE